VSLSSTRSSSGRISKELNASATLPGRWQPGLLGKYFDKTFQTLRRRGQTRMASKLTLRAVDFAMIARPPRHGRFK
jgi:hypothetical protein